MKYKQSDLTPWFSGRKKPVRVGVYQRQHSAYSGSTKFSFWDGDRWCYSHQWVRDATFDTNESNFQNLPWRGLNKEPV